jgi:hypothetical protein
MSSGGHFDAFKNETFTVVKILGALGDYMKHCEKVFLTKESKSFIQRIINFSLR